MTKEPVGVLQCFGLMLASFSHLENEETRVESVHLSKNIISMPRIAQN